MSDREKPETFSMEPNESVHAKHGRSIERPRVTLALRGKAPSNTRLVCAPAGSGKSIALNQYAERSSGSVAYIQLPENAPISDIERLIERCSWADEMVLDGFDDAASDAIETFVARLAAGAYRCRFILAGRSKLDMRANQLIESDLATPFDSAVFAFNASEVEHLATLRNVAHTAEDVEQILHDTDGWAIAVDWIISCAAHDSRPLRGAFDLWLAMGRRFFLPYLAAHSARKHDEFVSFQRTASNGTASQQHLEEFQALGFPVVQTRTAMQPHRVIRTLAGVDQSDLAPAGAPLLVFKLLGRFRCEIDGRPVPFKRRRDRHVLTYIALKPQGTASRDELTAAFWPDVAPAAARQGLRTTLARIRVALADVVGAEAVDLFLSSEGPVQVTVSNRCVDAQRFAEHVELARLEDARGNASLAIHHYAIAESLYHGPLLSTEPAEACFAAIVTLVETQYVTLLSRLVELYTAEKDHEAAHKYYLRLAKRRGERVERGDRPRTARTRHTDVPVVS